MTKTQVNTAFAKPGISHARQYPLVAQQTFTFVEVNESAAVTIMTLPRNSVVIGGFLVVDTAWDSTGAMTLSVGDTSLTTRYATTVDLKTAAKTALTVNGYDNTGGLNIIGTGAVTSTADLTAGSARLVVEYIIDNRANEVDVV